MRPVIEGMLVQLDGITQLVVTNPVNDQTPRQLLNDMLRQNRYDLRDQACVGVSYYDKDSSEATFCVWIKKVNTVFDETACGSGTAAIGIALATKASKSMSLSVMQPSSKAIYTEAKFADGRISKSIIIGKVDVLFDGEFRLP